MWGWIFRVLHITPFRKFRPRNFDNVHPQNSYKNEFSDFYILPALRKFYPQNFNICGKHHHYENEFPGFCILPRLRKFCPETSIALDKHNTLRPWLFRNSTYYPLKGFRPWNFNNLWPHENSTTMNSEYTSCDVRSILHFFLAHHVNSAPSVLRRLVGRSSLILLRCSALLAGVGCLATPLLVVLLGRLSLSPVTLTCRRWGMWVVPDLILQTSAVKTPLDWVTFPGVMPWLLASIAGYPRPSVGVVASTCIVVGIVVPGRPLV